MTCHDSESAPGAAADSESPPPHAVVAEAFVTGKGFHLAHTKRFIASQCDHGYALRECRVRLADSNRPGLSQASRQGPVIDNNDGGSTKLGRHTATLSDAGWIVPKIPDAL